MFDLTDREKAALRGELSFADWCEIGIDLFAKGLVTVDPLAFGTPLNPYELTQKGRIVALALRETHECQEHA